MKTIRNLFYLLSIFLFLLTSFSYADTGDSCSHAEQIPTIPTTINNVDLDYRWRSGRYYVYGFTAPTDGTVHIYTTGADTDTDMDFYNNNCDRIGRDDSYNDNIDFTDSVSSSQTYALDLYNYDRRNHGGFTLYIDFIPDTSADLSLTEYSAPSPDPVSLGNNVTFYVRLNNLGTSSAQGDIVIQATYDQSVTIVSATQVDGGGEFSCSVSTTTITCTKTNEMLQSAPNKDFEFIVEPSAEGTLTQTVSVTSPTYDPVTSNNTLTSSVTVNNPPSPPVAQNLNLVTSVGVPVQFSLPASDPNNDPLTFTINTQPSQGTLSCTAAGSCTYTPNGGFTGTDSFTFTATDPTPYTSNVGTVSITVSEQASIIATDNIYKVDPNDTLTGNLLTEDTGSGVDQGQNLVVTNITSPSKGTLSWNANGSFTYTPSNNAVGVDTMTYTITDAYGQTATASFSINILDFSQSNPLPFEKIWINGEENTNIYGDLTVIGNQSLCWMNGGNTCQNPPSSASNNSYYQEYANLDQTARTAGYLNSTSADLTLGEDDEVIDAWLFWIGRIYNENSKVGVADRIRLKTPTSNGYVTLYSQPDRFGWMVSGSYFDYGCAVNIKDYVTSSGTYWVADLQATEMKNQGSGWAIAVIIKDKTNGTVRSIKNISLYSGFTGVYSSSSDYPDDITQHISGFKTPREGDVDANLIFFGGESDRDLDDRMSLTDKYGTEIYVKDSKDDTHNVQNGTISRNGVNVTDRNPNFENTLGVDIDEIAVGNTNGGLDIIKTNQTETDITLYSEDDRIFLAMFGFATELYQPNVCYDYVSKLNEFVIPYTDKPAYRTYAEPDDELSVTIAIWDISGDIDPQYVSIGLNMHQTYGQVTPIRNPDKAFYSYTNGNTLLPTDYASMSTTQRPVITIGHDRTADIGGTILPDERYFTKFYFNVIDTNDSLIAGDFSVEVNATLNYGSGDFWQILNIDRCEQNPTYTPTWVQFNTEQIFTGDIPTDPTTHYSLPTRIAGRDFNYAVAVYGLDSNDKYTIPTPANGTTVDVEMIDISAFDDNNSFFKCTNTEPSIIMMPGNLVHFDNNISRLNVTYPDDLTGTYPVRNATFRMWLLTEENGTLIPEDQLYLKNNNAHYATLYNDKFKDRDVTNICLAACTSPYDYTSPRATSALNADPTAVGCYACLRDNFAQPFCARDNFAIRPKAIQVNIGDRGLDGNLSSVTIAKNIQQATEPDNTITIAAGYPYELNLTTVNNIDLPVLGYRTDDFYIAQNNIATLPSKLDQSAALLTFNGLAACNDQNNSTLGVRFAAGRSNSQFRMRNTSSYQFEIWDSNWTIVDRAYNNPYKTLFSTNCANSSDAACNDCILGTTTDDANDADKVGCTFGSSLVALDGTQKTSYTPVDLTVNPYRFGLTFLLRTQPSTAAGNTQNWAYMNDLTKSTGMAIVIDGNITALGADGTVTTNYVTGCSAQDSILWLDRNMSTDEALISTVKTPTSVYFQQWLNADAGAVQPVLDNRNGPDMNATLTAINYAADQNGSAHIALYYNFEKPYDDVVNPVIVNFKTLLTAAPNAASYANQLSNYIPDGNVSIDSNRTFYYAAVFPADGTDGTEIYTPDTSTSTTISVDIYCENIGDINCSLISSAPENAYLTGGWWRSEAHKSLNGDGQITQLTSDVAGVVFNPAQPAPIGLDNNGSTGTITISYPLTPRPVHPRITITPDEWLKYSPDAAANGLPAFTLHFLTQGLRWKGTGKTGHVVESEPSTGDNNRLNW